MIYHSLHPISSLFSTTASIGLFRSLDRLGVPVGFFKALGQPHHGETFDRSSAYLRNAGTEVTVPPVSESQASSYIAEGKIDDLMEIVVERFDTIPKHQNTIIVEGIVPTATLTNADEINAAIARALNAVIILVLRPCENTTAVIAKQLSDALNRLPASLLEIKPADIIYHFDSTKLAADHGYSSQGLRKPVNDLSRGASIDDIIYTIALTASKPNNLLLRPID